MVKQITAGVLSVFVLTATMGGVANAQTTDGLRSRLQNQAQSRQSDRLEKCEVIEKRIVARLEEIKENAEKKKAKYKQLRERVQNFVTTAKEKGADTTKLEADLAVLDEKISTYASEATKFYELLKKTQDFTCGKSEGEFRAALQAARAQLEVVHAASKDVHTYFRGTIIPDIKAVKDQIKE